VTSILQLKNKAGALSRAQYVMNKTVLEEVEKARIWEFTMTLLLLHKHVSEKVKNLHDVGYN